MRVSELFRRLSFGELSNLAMSSEGSGEILEKDFPKLILYTNDGLLSLFTRFILSEKNLILEEVVNVTNYHLKKQFSESSGSNEENHYIKDLITEPFQEDVIKIVEVYDSFGQKRSLNDKDDPWSLFTPQPDTLQVPHPIQGKALGIMYQARHVLLKDRGNNNEILSQDIDLPFYLESALQLFVASKVYTHMNGQENIAKSQEYEAAYNTKCGEVLAKDLVNNSFHTSFTKLEHRGFV